MTIPANPPPDEIATLRMRLIEVEGIVQDQARELDALRNQSTLFQAILDAIPDMVLCKGPVSRIVYANQAFREYYGMSNAELQDMIDAPFNEPDYTQQYIADDLRVFTTGETLDIPHEPVTRFDGQVALFHTRKSAIRNAQSDITHTFGISRNITEYEQAAGAMQEQVARFQRLSASVPGMVYQFVLSPDGSTAFPFVSNGSRELYGVEPEEAQRDSTLLLNAPVPEIRANLVQAIGESAKHLTPWEWEGQIVTQAGATKWVQGVARPARQADGSVVWDGIVIDITARKVAELGQARLQEEIIRAQKYALAELSTPLIPVSDDVVVLPLIGSLDTRRAQEVMEVLLTGIAQNRARIAIVDITGVQIVDTHVANTLVRVGQAIKLLGARMVLTGIRPEVAQTIVNLGIDLSDITTRATLQSGIEEALRR